MVELLSAHSPKVEFKPLEVYDQRVRQLLDRATPLCCHAFPALVAQVAIVALQQQTLKIQKKGRGREKKRRSCKNRTMCNNEIMHLPPGLNKPCLFFVLFFGGGRGRGEGGGGSCIPFRNVHTFIVKAPLW